MTRWAWMTSGRSSRTRAQLPLAAATRAVGGIAGSAPSGSGTRGRRRPELVSQWPVRWHYRGHLMPHPGQAGYLVAEPVASEGRADHLQYAQLAVTREFMHHGPSLHGGHLPGGVPWP